MSGKQANESSFKGIHYMAEKITNQSKPRVLVADDEQVIANTLAIILNQAGFEARAVYSGEKAIDALDTFHPDMLISDVIMTGQDSVVLWPGGDGGPSGAGSDPGSRVRDPGETRASDRSAGEAEGIRDRPRARGACPRACG
jgi:hypothetical protein